MIRSIAIYPANWAALNVEQAGQKYRPGSGTEGVMFMEAWCGSCQRDKSMREGAPLEDCDDDERCDIIADTFAYAVDDPKYPSAWQYGKDGQPCCTAFVEAGQPIPHKDEHTLNLFTTAAAQAATDKPLTRCAAARDGDCSHQQCPQARDGEPHKSQRHCPLDTYSDED